MKKSILFITLLLVLFSGCYNLQSNVEDQNTQNSSPQDNNSQEERIIYDENTQSIPVEEINGSIEQTNNIRFEDSNFTGKTFNFNMTNYEYSRDEIQVKLNETVRIILYSKEGDHNFEVSELALKTSVIEEGEYEIVEFKITNPETEMIQYFSGYQDQWEKGMFGNITVIK